MIPRCNERDHDALEEGDCDTPDEGPPPRLFAL